MGTMPRKPGRSLPSYHEKAPRFSARFYLKLAKLNANYWKLTDSARAELRRFAHSTGPEGALTTFFCCWDDKSLMVAEELRLSGWFFIFRNKEMKSGCQRDYVQLTLPRGIPRERL